MVDINSNGQSINNVLEIPTQLMVKTHFRDYSSHCSSCMCNTIFCHKINPVNLSTLSRFY